MEYNHIKRLGTAIPSPAEKENKTMKKLIRGMDDIIYIASGARTYMDIECSLNAETGGGNITVASYDDWADAIKEIEYAVGHIADFVEMSAEAEQERIEHLAYEWGIPVSELECLR